MSTYFVFLFSVFILRRIVRIEHIRETFRQGNLLKGIDNKAVRREFTYILFSVPKDIFRQAAEFSG